MTRQVGSQTRIGTVVPGFSKIKRTVSLSKAAKLRLSWMDYYRLHGNNASLTCRHYGIAKSCFYKWLKRYHRQGLAGLENYSTRPKTVRRPLVPLEVLQTVKSLRQSNPEYSKYKLEVILKRDYDYCLSASTIGRIISRHQLFFASPVKPKRHPARYGRLHRLRKPKDLQSTKPGQVVEVDVKHLPVFGGTKRYSFVAIDTYSKQASVFVSSTITSTAGVKAWQRAKSQLNLDDTVTVVTDNGSENYGFFERLLKDQGLVHYFARPRTPKDKPFVERFIGTLERECIQWGGIAIDKEDQQQIIDRWLDKYHNYRPHQALDYLTPNEFKAKIDSEVSSMY